MPSVYDLKPKFQNLLRPLVNLLARIGVTANMVTLAAMLGSIAYGIWIYQPFADPRPQPVSVPVSGAVPVYPHGAECH
jgi:CDP-diacylglycerol---glycerol-3-phosphate 3-phosphatidyltransferase